MNKLLFSFLLFVFICTGCTKDYYLNSDFKASKVSFQAVEKTNVLLYNQEISAQRSWKMTEEELTEILGVNAVIKTRVEKQRYMSDLASRGISIGKRLFGTLTHFKPSIAEAGARMGKGLEKTSDINTSCTIVNGKDGSTLWSMNLTSATDWQRPSFEVIDRINRKMAKDMPYRAK